MPRLEHGPGTIEPWSASPAPRRSPPRRAAEPDERARLFLTHSG
ncbi:hypothetical protein AB0945_22185 [Streptomyces sp. NPDC005474]